MEVAGTALHVLATFLVLSGLASFAVVFGVVHHEKDKSAAQAESAATRSNPAFSHPGGEVEPLLAASPQSSHARHGHIGGGGGGYGVAKGLPKSSLGAAGLAGGPAHSLLMARDIPFWVRVGFPACLFLNITLFAYSNTAVGASVIPVLKIGAENAIWLQPLFAFDLANSIKDMWLAGV